LDESELNTETAILVESFTEVNYPWSFLYATSREGIPVISGLSILHTKQLRFLSMLLVFFPLRRARKSWIDALRMKEFWERQLAF